MSRHSSKVRGWVISKPRRLISTLELEGSEMAIELLIRTYFHHSLRCQARFYALPISAIHHPQVTVPYCEAFAHRSQSAFNCFLSTSGLAPGPCGQNAASFTTLPPTTRSKIESAITKASGVRWPNQSSNHRLTASGLNRTRWPSLRKGSPCSRRVVTWRILHRA
jgi:hypothetical protein